MVLKKGALSAIIILVSLMTIISLSGLNFVFKEKNIEKQQQNENQKDNQADQRINVSSTMEKITLKTSDGLSIASNFYSVQSPAGWVVFTHAMPDTKESWDNLAKSFQSLGYESVAFDLRGHGESQGGPDGYKNFEDAAHQNGILDLESAVGYLVRERKAEAGKIFLVGASIGANLSLKYLEEHPGFEAAVLLSPGLDYWGIRTEPLVKSLGFGQKVFFVTSKDDNGNTEESQKLYDLIPQGVKKEIKIYEKAGHGTTMLQKEADLKNLILKFLINE